MRSIFAKRLFLERSKFFISKSFTFLNTSYIIIIYSQANLFFSNSFAVLKNGFIIVMYSKAKQTANKYGEKRIKK